MFQFICLQGNLEAEDVCDLSDKTSSLLSLLAVYLSLSDLVVQATFRALQFI